ncbi:flagellar hook-associated family protein [Aestuariivirga sp.]|jgi:flagellar hook-associated protein 3 FlgL|uniref:flagellar hook-associated family protein n=1 Tax=Aestuariivirga sp. TaxID=2650926 RepID=UPI0037849225
MAGIEMIPSHMLLQPARQSISTAQKSLSSLQTETTTGRHADIGLALGTRTADSAALRLALQDTLIQGDIFSQSSVKAEVTQTALTALSDLAQRFRSTLTVGKTSETGRVISTQAAQASLQAFRDLLATTYNSEYLFSGQNSDISPINDYHSGPRARIISAFQDSFGFEPSNPAAAQLSSDQLFEFVTGAMEELFSGDNWRAAWSNATEFSPTIRLSSIQSTRVLATADSDFAQKLAYSFSVIEVLGSSAVNDAAFSRAVDIALGVVSEGQLLVEEQQALIGSGQKTLESARAQLSIQKTMLSKAIQDLEGVDLFDVATRTNLVMSTLEASYALTSRLGRLSILSYLR